MDHEPVAARTGEDPSGAHHVPHGKDRTKRSRLTRLIVFCGVLVVAILVLTVATWSDPLWPLILYYGLIVMPVGLFLLSQSRSDLRELKTFLAYAAMLGLPFIAWNVSLYRTAVFHVTWRALPTKTVLLAAQDRAPRVAAVACDRAYRLNSVVARERMTPILEYRPASAALCLNSLSEREPERAANLARELTRRWYRDMMGSEVIPAAHGCASAEAFPEVAPLLQTDGAAHLLNCALAGAQSEVAACCADVVEARFPAEDSPDVSPDRLDPDVSEPLFLNLARSVDAPTEKLLRDRASDWAVAWPPSVQLHWAARLGCHLIDEVHRPERIAAELARLTHLQCGLDVENTFYSHEATRLMRRTCEPIDAPEEGGEIDLYEWCAAARGAAQETAVESASFAVYQARDAYFVEKVAGTISQGARAEESRADMYGTLRPESFDVLDSPETVNTETLRGDRHDWLDLSPADRERMARAVGDGDVALPSADDQLRRLQQRRRQLGENDPRAARLDAIIEDARRRSGQPRLPSGSSLKELRDQRPARSGAP